MGGRTAVKIRLFGCPLGFEYKRGKGDCRADIFFWRCSRHPDFRFFVVSSFLWPSFSHSSELPKQLRNKNRFLVWKNSLFFGKSFFLCCVSATFFSLLSRPLGRIYQSLVMQLLVHPTNYFYKIKCHNFQHFLSNNFSRFELNFRLISRKFQRVL